MARGRPSKYDSTIKGDFELLTNLCRLGLTNGEIAEFYGIHVDTVYDWQKKYEQFSDAIKKGRLVGLGKVVAALHKRATGFTQTIKKQTVFKGEVVEYSDTQYFPPDTSAAAILLNNRMRSHWRQRWDDAPKEAQYQPPTTIEIAPAACATNGCSGFGHPGAGEGTEYCKKCREKGEE